MATQRKIIFISTRIPARSEKGDQLTAFYRLKSFIEKGFKVDLICFQMGSKEKFKNNVSFLSNLKNVNVHIVKFSLLSALLNIFFGVILNKNIPIQCLFFKNKKFSKKIYQLIKENDTAIIYSNLIRPLANIKFPVENLYVDLVDSIFLNYSRRLNRTKSIKNLFFYFEMKKLKHFESFVVENSLESSVVSEQDKKNISIQKKLIVIPNGVDCSVFLKRKKFLKVPSVVFFGNLSYFPNADGILWFINNVWSLVLDQVSNAKLTIIGGGASKKLLKLISKFESISYCGYVDSIEFELRNYSVSIAPLQSGSGIQNKILESMCAGVPVVASCIAAKGLPEEAKDNIKIGSSPEIFSSHICNLLIDKELNNLYSESGRKYIKLNHDWKLLNSKISFLSQK